MAQKNSKNMTAHPIFDECLELLDTAVWKLLSSTSTLQYVLLVSFSTYACYDYACMHHSVRYTRRRYAGVSGAADQEQLGSPIFQLGLERGTVMP